MEKRDNKYLDILKLKITLIKNDLELHKFYHYNQIEKQHLYLNFKLKEIEEKIEFNNKLLNLDYPKEIKNNYLDKIKKLKNLADHFKDLYKEQISKTVKNFEIHCFKITKELKELEETYNDLVENKKQYKIAFQNKQLIEK